MDALRCFVAMAFDRDDTDALFDHIIKPVIRAIPAVPVRVDRIEHNDDINTRIISELEQCDFGIADLTYARPSVYFEAGFAQSRVPVVYTCRRDHLRPRVDDEHGNYRVHFDLQMKNIVAWTDPKDCRFKERLQSRLGRTIQPLLRKRRAKVESWKAIQAFNALSLTDKVKRITSTAQRELQRAGFRKNKIIASVDFSARRAEWVGTKGDAKSVQIAALYLLARTGWRDIRERIGWGGLDLRLAEFPASVNQVEQHLFFLSLQRIPPTRAALGLSYFAFDEEMDRYSHERSIHLSLERRVPSKVYVYLITGISSEPSLNESLRRCLRNV